MKQQKVMRIVTCTLVLFALFIGIIPEGNAAMRKKIKDNGKAETSYQKLFKGKKISTSTGMMTLHVMDGKVYAEFPLALLGKDMLLTSSIKETSDHGEGVVGQFGGKPLHVVFTKADSMLEARLVLADRLMNRTLEKGVEQAIDEANMAGVFRDFKVEAYTPDSSALVVDMTKLFLEHSYYTTPFPDYAGNSYYGLITRDHKFEEERSLLKGAKAYANNVIVECEMSYNVDHVFFGIFFLQKDAPVTIIADKILMLLPEKIMRPRIADPRIGTGYFETSELESARQGLKTVYFSNRWRIEPIDSVAYARGQVVEPKKPIVFYLDTLMPLAWKKYVQAGVEEWNQAFEKIGFKKVVRVMEFPRNDTIFNANDLNYSTIRYSPLAMDEMQTSIHTDPRSGEILNASIYFHDNVKSTLYMSRVLATMASDPEVRHAVLSEEVMGDLIRTRVMQSVGECLGLSLNMGASYAYAVDSLRSASFTQQYGLSPSIMDDLVCNYIAQPGDVRRGVRLTPKGVGVYDEYAIKWLYCPILEVRTYAEESVVLDKWMKEAAQNSMCRYRKRQYLTTLYDPTTLYGDLGNDHLKAMDYYNRNLKLAIQHYNEWYKDGDRDLDLRGVLYDNLIYAFKNNVGNIMTYIGGIYLNEVREGDAGVTYAGVPRAKQREALQYLINLTEDLSWLDNGDAKYQYNLKDLVPEATRSWIFGDLFYRVGFVALGAEKSADAYTAEEYVEDIYKIVWDKTLSGRMLTKVDMNLQGAFVAGVVATSSVTGSADSFDPATPSDAFYLSNSSRYLNEMLRDQFSLHGKSGVRLRNKVERQGFDPVRKIEARGISTAALFYDMLLRVKALLTTATRESSGEMQSHYGYLLYKVNKALKND